MASENKRREEEKKQRDEQDKIQGGVEFLANAGLGEHWLDIKNGSYVSYQLGMFIDNVNYFGKGKDELIFVPSPDGLFTDIQDVYLF